MLNNATILQQKRRAQGRFVKARVIEAGLSFRQIAQRLGVSPSLVSHVINGRRPSPRVRRAIAEALHTSVDALWPDNSHTSKAA
ncbi:MAG: helix-turn-helix transcriptional regulator [Candidatus Methylomirabilis oxyfera]|nr:helix-turn-helix transcriptional regulator [Candidatus Methylomirabilis oxyfera]